MKLTLHIGTEKTGTTTIQEFLRLNYKTLRGHSIYTSTALGPERCSNILVQKSSCRYYLEEKKSPKQNRYINNSFNFFLSEVKKTAFDKDAHWVISSELLQSRLRDYDQLHSLKGLLDPLFETISILLYIRKPIDTAVSLWSTGVKCGGSITSLPDPKNAYWNNACNHKNTIERWGDVFSDSLINIRLFQKEDFAGEDLISDFLYQINPILKKENFTAPERKNESISRTSLLLLAHVNSICPKKRLITNNIINDLSDLPAYHPSKNEIDKYNEEFRESDEWVRSNFFPHKRSLWSTAKFKIKSTTEELERHGVPEKDLVRIAKLLVKVNQRRICPGAFAKHLLNKAIWHATRSNKIILWLYLKMRI